MIKDIQASQKVEETRRSSLLAEESPSAPAPAAEKPSAETSETSESDSTGESPHNWDATDASQKWYSSDEESHAMSNEPPADSADSDTSNSTSNKTANTPEQPSSPR